MSGSVREGELLPDCTASYIYLRAHTNYTVPTKSGGETELRYVIEIEEDFLFSKIGVFVTVTICSLVDIY
jgi:hypothetical protein